MSIQYIMIREEGFVDCISIRFDNLLRSMYKQMFRKEGKFIFHSTEQRHEIVNDLSTCSL